MSAACASAAEEGTSNFDLQKRDCSQPAAARCSKLHARARAPSARGGGQICGPAFFTIAVDLARRGHVHGRQAQPPPPPSRLYVARAHCLRVLQITYWGRTVV